MEIQLDNRLETDLLRDHLAATLGGFFFLTTKVGLRRW
jgi:hypothetical protein